MLANYDMQEAFLKDIQEINRIQAEQGLPTLSAASNTGTIANTGAAQKLAAVPVKRKTEVVGKILKPPG